MSNVLFEGLESRTFLSSVNSSAQLADYAAPLAAQYAHARRAVDRTAPASTLKAAVVTAAGGKLYTFSVVYTDPSKVKRATLGTGDILVTYPNGFKATATFVSATSKVNAASITATYSIVPPGGAWTAAANGTYTVTLNAKEVSDALGNTTAAARVIKTFAVTIVDPAVPTFTKGPDQTVNENAAPQTVGAWATNINAGTTGTTPAFTATTDNYALFSAAPAVAADGTLTYTPAANAFGVAHVTVQLQNSGGTSTATFAITVNLVNVAPSFAAGANQAINEAAGAQTVAGWATNISAGPAGESGQALAFLVNTDNNAIFAYQPGISANGTLTYTPATNNAGVAHVTVRLKDNGGVANGGVDTSVVQTFTITVNPVNQPPSFAKGANQSVVKGAGAQTVINWATSISPGGANESAQAVSFLVSSDNSSLFSAGPAIGPDGTLTYTPAPGASGVAHITVRLQDNGGTANGGVDTSVAQAFTINVTVPQIPSLVGTYNGSLIIPAVGHYRNAVLTITQQNANGAFSGTLVGDSVVSTNVSGTMALDGTFTITVVTPPNTNHPGGPIDGTGTGTLDSTGKNVAINLTFSAYGTTFPGTVTVTKA